MPQIGSMIGRLVRAEDTAARLGPDLFAQMLKDTEMVDVPVEQLEAAGKADLERNTAALKSECAAYAPKATLAQCIAKVDADKPKQGPVAEARSMLPMLRDFVVQNKVVSIPNDTQALVAQAPPYNAQNAAYINVPGPFDKKTPSGFKASTSSGGVCAGTTVTLHPSPRSLRRMFCLIPKS